MVDVISGGSGVRVIGRKRRGSSESIFIVFDQSSKREQPYPNTIISFSDEDYPLDTVESHEGHWLS